MKSILSIFSKLFGVVICCSIYFGCYLSASKPNLVPNESSLAPNYWCTWYWQNYLIEKGKEVANPDPTTVYTNQAARENVNQETIFGVEGMAHLMLPRTRGDYFFVIDHGWQDKRIDKSTFFTLPDQILL